SLDGVATKFVALPAVAFFRSTLRLLSRKVCNIKLSRSRGSLHCRARVHVRLSRKYARKDRFLVILPESEATTIIGATSQVKPVSPDSHRRDRRIPGPERRPLEVRAL